MRTLVDGSEMTVTRRRFYAPGDIVVVRRADHWTAHRLLGLAPGRKGLVALTQADASDTPDPACLFTQIVGAVEGEVSWLDRTRSGFRYTRALWMRALRGLP